MDAHNELQGFKNDLADQFLERAAMLALGCIALSIVMTTEAGWQPIYVVHLVLGISAGLLLGLRRWMQPIVKSVAVSALCWMVGVAAIMAYGFSAGGAASLSQGFELKHYVDSSTTTALLIGASVFAPVLILSMLAMMQKSAQTLVEKTERECKQFEHLAMHDELTGLPSFRLAKDRLNQALTAAKRNKKKAAVIFLDMDRFKQVNDEHGHDVGDRILKIVGQRMKNMLREGDTVARRSGDEFLVVLPEVQSEEATQKVADLLVSEINVPVPVGKEPDRCHSKFSRVGVSAGVALYPDDGADVATLLSLSDEKMYRNKRQHKVHDLMSEERFSRLDESGNYLSGNEAFLNITTS